ncbi:MAG TPA: hypothetical protein VGO91_04200 [Pyrinomonadaceae bacterium]|jgi:hypothetical protein|nr:hypothetical protein [Pyrinomonadaceae bacterium]
MNCQIIRRKIEEAELDQSPCDEVAAHLRACELCRNFQEERAALRQLVGSLGMVSAPADFDYRLRARLAASNNARRRGLFGFLPAPGVPAIALAASFAVLVAAAVIFKSVAPSGPGVHERGQIAATTPEPSSNASASRPVASERKDSNENMDQSGNTPAVMKNAALASKNLTAELRARNRSNRSLKPGDERAMPAATNAVAVGPQHNSLDSSSRPASVISLVAVQVPVADQPMKVSLEDRRGTTRTVSLQPVTFGSEELIRRNNPSRVPASSPKGIW